MYQPAQSHSTLSLICQIGLICLIATFGLHGRVAAASPAPSPSTSPANVSLVVSPPSFTLDAKPGDTLQQTIQVTNSGTSEVTLQALVNDYIVMDNQGTPVRVTTTASGRYLASPWFTLERNSLTLKPGATEQVIVIISVPKDALPGGHYAGVFFLDNPNHTPGKTASYTAAQVGSLFKLTVAGNIKYSAVIKNFSVDNHLYEFGPVNFSASIENQSDTQISPKASIAVYDMVGRKLADLPLDQVNIFPFVSRNLSTTWNTVWGLGRYTATLTAAYGPSGAVESRTLQFWILPYRLLAAVGVVLMVLFVIFILIRRHLKSRDDHRDEEIENLKRKIVEMENQQR